MLNVIDVQPEAYHTVNQWRCEQFAPGAPQDISMAERDLWHLDSADHEWRHSLLKDIPNYLARYLLSVIPKSITAVSHTKPAAVPIRFYALPWVKIYCHVCV